MLSASKWTPLLLSELSKQIIRSTLQILPANKQVSVNVPSSPVRVTSDQAHHLALMINELATNTIKHALSNQETIDITICIRLEDGTVLFEFRDNGPGYPEEVLRLNQRHHNIGFELIQNVVRRGLRGELAVYNDNGAVVMIQFQDRGNM
jgi:two-component sensor histidine kinase